MSFLFEGALPAPYDWRTTPSIGGFRNARTLKHKRFKIDSNPQLSHIFHCNTREEPQKTDISAKNRMNAKLCDSRRTEDIIPFN